MRIKGSFYFFKENNHQKLSKLMRSLKSFQVDFSSDSSITHLNRCTNFILSSSFHFLSLDSETMGHVVPSGTANGHHELWRVSSLYARQSTHIIIFPPILRETLPEGIALASFTLQFYYLTCIR